MSQSLGRIAVLLVPKLVRRQETRETDNIYNVIDLQ